MAIVIHFKDNTTAEIGNATDVCPFKDGTEIDDNFVECTIAGGARVALIAVVDFKYAVNIG